MTQAWQIDPPREILDKLLALYEAEQRAVVMDETGRLLEAFPASYTLWKLFGAALMSEGFPEQAELALRQALALRPDLEEAQKNHAIADQLLRDISAAASAEMLADS